MKYSVWLVLVLMSAPVMAETTIYGQIKTGISTTNQTATPIKYSTSQPQPSYSGHNHQTQVNDHGSFIGLHGQEQLGDTTLKAIWQIEQDVPIGRSNRQY